MKIKIPKGGLELSASTIGIGGGLLLIAVSGLISGITGLIGIGSGAVQTIGAVMVGASIISIIAKK